jgi:SAM-dependent methyltransferase
MSDTLNYGHPQIDIYGALPEKLDRSIAALLHAAGEFAISNEKLNSLRMLIGQNGIPRYESEWAAFTYLYYSANFLKSFLAVSSAVTGTVGRPLRVLDLGCGGGASTAAAVAALRYSGNFVELVTGVDQSEEQLKVFREVTQLWLEDSFTGTQIQLRKQDILQYLENIEPIYDLVLLSYVVPEFDEGRRNRLLAMLRTIQQNQACTVLLVDSDPSHRGLRLEILGDVPFLLPYNNVYFQTPALEEMGFLVPPKFSRSRQGDLLIVQYFGAWESHDINLLRKTLSKECLYFINGKDALRGIQEVLSYWEHNAMRQRNVHTQFQIISSSALNATFLWSAEFERIDTNDHRKLDGIMHLTFRQGRISTLHEHYSQEITRLSKP